MLPFRLAAHGAAAVCAVCGALLYLNTLQLNFCFDDLSAIKENKDLRPSTPWSQLLQDDFWGTAMHIEGSHKSYRPVCVASFRLNYMLHGLHPMGYHLLNVLLHALVCYLYVQLCALVFTQIWPALLAGLLFAVHPIHTEAVAGVVGRAELLSSLLFLLTLMFYHWTLQAQSHREQTLTGGKWLLLTLLSCFLSVLCKEQGITAVVVCLTYDLFIFHKHTLQSSFKLFFKGGSWPQHFMWRVFILMGFTLAVMFLRLQIMQTTLPVFTVHDNPAVAFPSPYRQLHWLYLVAVNLQLLLSPSPLCADWTMGTIPPIASLWDPRNLATLASILSLSVLSCFSLTSSKERAKACLLALALMVFPFLPASNLLFPVGFVVAERVLYLPSMGYCMLVALGVWLVHQSGFRKVVFLAVVCGAVLSLKTVTRNGDWRDDNTLFRSAIRVNPDNGKLYNNLGHNLEDIGDHLYAEKLFRFASRVQPDDIGAFINHGRVLKQLQRFQEAEQVYLQAIELMPTGKSFRVAPSHINVYYNLANLVKMDPARQQEAYKLYQRAISMKPDFVEAHMNKGDLLLHLNRTDEAREAFEMALKHNPEYTDAHYNLGSALLQMNRRAEAEKSYRTALKLNSNHIHALLGLAGLLQDERRNEEAFELFQQVLLIDPTNARAQFYLALLYLDQQKLDMSEQMFLKALSSDPTYRSALYNLAVLYNHLKRTKEAIHYLQQLVLLYPEHLNGAQLLADCYMKIGELKAAEEMYQHVLKRNQQHPAALHNLGVMKAESGNLDEAISLFEKVLLLEPSHATARKHLQQAKMQATATPTKPDGPT